MLGRMSKLRKQIDATPNNDLVTLTVGSSF